MSEYSLRGRRILVVEDNEVLADAICDSLLSLGAIVIGPVGRCGDALQRIDAESSLDAAILDADLHGEFSSPIARRLLAMRVPFLLATGYEPARLPPVLRDAPRCQKPTGFTNWMERLGALLQPATEH